MLKFGICYRAVYLDRATLQKRTPHASASTIAKPIRELMILVVMKRIKSRIPTAKYGNSEPVRVLI
jgi:hypothetical protein